jgi:IS4 transposase
LLVLMGSNIIQSWAVSRDTHVFNYKAFFGYDVIPGRRYTAIETFNSLGGFTFASGYTAGGGINQYRTEALRPLP